MDTAAAVTKASTPIVLAAQLGNQGEYPTGSVVVNLGQQIPTNFEQFERLIEIASQQPDDRLAALSRWKYYKDRGYALKRHDAGAAERSV